MKGVCSMTRFALLAFLVGALLANVVAADDKSDIEFGANASLGGTRLLPEDSPWNQDISSAPVDPKSGAILARIGMDKPLHADFGSEWEGVPLGIPYVVVGTDQEEVPLAFEIPEESDADPTRSRLTPRSREDRTATATGTCSCSTATNGSCLSSIMPSPTTKEAGRRAAVPFGILRRTR